MASGLRVYRTPRLRLRKCGAGCCNCIPSFILFFAYGAIFNSVYGEYLDTMIRQRGNDIGSIIEGSLYYSMLKNDDDALQSTLEIINTISGVDEVNLYDHENELVYSSHFRL